MILRALVKTDPNRRPICSHCGKVGHVEKRCWKKFPNLNPHLKNKISSALIANANEDEEAAICLIANYENAGAAKNTDDWFIDSGCSHHMTHDKSLFSSYSAPSKSKTVEVGGGNALPIVGSGHIVMNICVEGKAMKCELRNVLHVPALGYQLLSVPTWDKMGLRTTFEGGSCLVSNMKSKILASGTLFSTLYKLDLHQNAVKCPSNALVAQRSSSLA